MKRRHHPKATVFTTCTAVCNATEVYSTTYLITASVCRLGLGIYTGQCLPPPEITMRIAPARRNPCNTAGCVPGRLRWSPWSRCPPSHMDCLPETCMCSFSRTGQGRGDLYLPRCYGSSKRSTPTVALHAEAACRGWGQGSYKLSFSSYRVSGTLFFPSEELFDLAPYWELFRPCSAPYWTDM